MKLFNSALLALSFVFALPAKAVPSTKAAPKPKAASIYENQETYAKIKAIGDREYSDCPLNIKLMAELLINPLNMVNKKIQCCGKEYKIINLLSSSTTTNWNDEEFNTEKVVEFEVELLEIKGKKGKANKYTLKVVSKDSKVKQTSLLAKLVKYTSRLGLLAGSVYALNYGKDLLEAVKYSSKVGGVALSALILDRLINGNWNNNTQWS